jgi:hypothetical protein
VEVRINREQKHELLCQMSSCIVPHRLPRGQAVAYGGGPDQLCPPLRAVAASSSAARTVREATASPDLVWSRGAVGAHVRLPSRQPSLLATRHPLAPTRLHASNDTEAAPLSQAGERRWLPLRGAGEQTL